ncbi:MAG: hypothetical protein H0T82_01280 [Sphingomonas sp.]|nr:hypothetical protein [Sphingomonas sp.]
MLRTIFHCAVLAALSTVGAAEARSQPAPSAKSVPPGKIVAPGEFEPQEYIWLSWRDEGFLGTAPFADVATDVMKVITPHVKVRLMFSD